MKTILYHGSDHDFFDKLQETAETVFQCEVIRLPPEKGTLIQSAFDLRPHIIIVDSSFAVYLAEEVRKLKTLTDFKATLFVAYCKDELEVKEGEQLLVSGAHLFHLKDTDFDTFFRDCFQVAFEMKNTTVDFARAKNLEIPLTLGFLSTLTSIGPESFIIESDLQLQDEVALKLPMSATESALSVKVTERIEGNITSPFLYSYTLKFPFPGPWDEVSEDSLSKESVGTWIELREKYFDSRKETLAIFTTDNEFIRRIISSEGLSWYKIYQSVKEAHSSLSYIKPGVIIYDLQTEEGADLHELGELIGVVREISPSPMMVVHGSKSDSSALRKLFDYEFLIACPGRPELVMFQAMEKKFLAKSANQKEKYYLKPTDLDRSIEVRKTVILTSITEREITFIVDAEIPYFSVMKAELPLVSFLTVIPAESELPPSKKGTHYRALLHGVSEENLTKVRKIVNQLIYTPVKELSHDIVEIMLKQDYLQKEKSAEKKLPTQMATIKNEAEENRFIIQRNIRGKSKL